MGLLPISSLSEDKDNKVFWELCSLLVNDSGALGQENTISGLSTDVTFQWGQVNLQVKEPGLWSTKIMIIQDIYRLPIIDLLIVL